MLVGVLIFYFLIELIFFKKGHKLSYYQYDIFGIKNRQNNDKSSKLLVMLTTPY